MPSEKFYTPEQPVLEIGWSPNGEYEGVFLTVYEDTTPRTVVPLVSVLDRDDLNRMIRALRRARNATYGSDE